MFKKLHRRDIGFILLILANLLCISGFLSDSLHRPIDQTGGWRRINLKVLNDYINTGDLVNKEAEWYRPANDHTRPNTARGRATFLEGNPHDN